MDGSLYNCFLKIRIVVIFLLLLFDRIFQDAFDFVWPSKSHGARVSVCLRACVWLCVNDGVYVVVSYMVLYVWCCDILLWWWWRRRHALCPSPTLVTMVTLTLHALYTGEGGERSGDQTVRRVASCHCQSYQWWHVRSRDGRIGGTGARPLLKRKKQYSILCLCVQ